MSGTNFSSGTLNPVRECSYCVMASFWKLLLHGVVLECVVQ